MDAGWKISDRAIAVVIEGVRAYQARQPINFPFYPGIWWTPEGVAYKESDPEGTRITIPPKYGVVILDRRDMPVDEAHLLLPNNRFGAISFVPRDDDVASARRLIDYDGKDIVVRKA